MKRLLLVLPIVFLVGCSRVGYYEIDVLCISGVKFAFIESTFDGSMVLEAIPDPTQIEVYQACEE